MGVIHCCGALRRSQSFMLAPGKNFILSQLDILPRCSKCGHFVVQLTRIDFDNRVSVVRKTNQKARCFFEKLEPQILFELQSPVFRPCNKSAFWLGYNEFGKRKKCYSNLSSMNLGKLDNFAFLPKKEGIIAFKGDCQR